MKRKQDRNGLYGNNTTVLDAGFFNNFHIFIPNVMQELEEGISRETF